MRQGGLIRDGRTPHAPLVSRPLSRAARLANTPFLTLIALYRVTLSPIVGGQCRFHPTCSRYAQDAYRLHGPVRGSSLTLRRILRCHPLNPGGYDPVPIPEPHAPADPKGPTPPHPAPPDPGRSDP